jgi:hypothetical protein
VTTDLDELERLAKAATPDRWYFYPPRSSSPQARADADFMSAAKPAVVLDLVQRLRVAEAIVLDLAVCQGTIAVLRDCYQHMTVCCCVSLPKSPAERAKIQGLPHAESCPFKRAVEATK